MPYKQIQTGDFNPTWDFQNYKEVEFILKEKRENVGKFNHMAYTIEELTTKELFNIWGSAILNRQIEQMEIGQQGKLTYLGTVKSKQWDKDMQNFKLEIWEDD